MSVTECAMESCLDYLRVLMEPSDVGWAAIAAGVVGGADACLPSCCLAVGGSDDREGVVLAYQRALLAACEAVAIAVGLHTCRVVADASGSTEIAYANSLAF